MLNKEFQKTVDILLKVSAEGQKATASFRTQNSIKSFQQFESTAKSAVNGVSSAYKNLDQAQQAHVKALQNQQRASLNLATAERAEAVETAKLTLKRQELVKAAKRQAMEELGLISAYDKVVAKMNAAGKAVQNLNAKKLSGEKLSDREQKELTQSTKDFQKYQKAVLGADASIGRFQRNVGNYPKQLLAVGSAIKSLLPALGAAQLLRMAFDFSKEAVQLARDAKGVEFAFQKIEDRTGDAESALIRVRAATRGLLSDLEIKRAIVDLDNFNISTKETDTLMEFLAVRAAQTGKSIDSLKDSLVEGLSKESKLRIDNLGISAKELNDELEKTPDFVQAVANIARKEIKEAGDILDDAANSQEKFNAAFENFQIRAGNGFLARLTNQFYELGTAILTSTNQLNKDKSFSSYLNQLKQNADETIPLYIRQGQLTKELDDIEKKTLETREKLNDAKRWDIGLKNEETKILERLLSQYEGQYEAVYKYKELLKAQNKEQEDSNKSKIRDVAYLKELITLENEKLEGTTNRNDAKVIQDRIKALQNEIDAILGANNARKQGNNYLKGSLAYYDAEISKLETQQKNLARSSKEWENYQEKIDAAKKAQQDFILLVNGYSISFYESLISDLESEQKQVASNGREWQVYQDRIDAAKKSLQDLIVEIKGVNEGLKSIDDFASAWENLQNIISDTDFGKIDGLDYDRLNSDLEKFTKNFEKQQQMLVDIQVHYAQMRNDIEAELSENLTVLGQSVVDAVFQSQLEGIEKEMSVLERRTEMALQFAGDNAAAQEEIKRQSIEKQEALEKKRIETEKKAFLFQQAFKAGEIAIDTIQKVAALKAQAALLASNPVTAALASIPLGLIPVVITTGAVAGAAVIAQSIPAFEDGGTSPGGDILVNDAKRSNFKEIVVTPKGDVFRPQKRNTVMSPPKGSQIFKSERDFMDQLRQLTSTHNIMFDSDLLKVPEVSPTINVNGGLSKEDFNSGINELKKSIGTSKGAQITFDENGFRKFLSSGSGTTEILNNRFVFKSKKV